MANPRDELLQILEEADELIRVAIQYNRGIGVDAGTPFEKAIAESNRLVGAARRKLQGALDPPEKKPAPAEILER